MTALFVSLLLTTIHDVFSTLILTYLHFSQVRKPVLDTPTAKWSTSHAILALSALEDLELESIDISSVFLNGDLEEEVYMEQPEGFH